MIRRGRAPTVGITASQATIILRIAAEGQSREECETLIAHGGHDPRMPWRAGVRPGRRRASGRRQYGTGRARERRRWPLRSGERPGWSPTGSARRSSRGGNTSAVSSRPMRLPWSGCSIFRPIGLSGTRLQAGRSPREWPTIAVADRHHYALAIGGFPPADTAAADAPVVYFAVARRRACRPRPFPMPRIPRYCGCFAGSTRCSTCCDWRSWTARRLGRNVRGFAGST